MKVKSFIIFLLVIINYCIFEVDNAEDCKCKGLRKPLKKRQLLIFGQPRNLTIYYGPRSPNRAAAAMLLLIMKYNLGYDGINIEQGYRTLCDVATYAKEPKTNDDYNEVIVHLGAEYSEENDRRHCEALKKCDDVKKDCKAAGRRFDVMVPPIAPMTLYLQMKLSETAWNNAVCRDFNSWISYNNTEDLEQCGFRNLDNFTDYNIERPFQTSNNTRCINTKYCYPIFVQKVEEHLKTIVEELSLRIQHHNIPLEIVVLSESNLRIMISSSESSILFLDYDLWAEDTKNRVRLVQPPPCVTVSCHHEFNKTEALVVGDAETLYVRGRLLFDTINVFTLPPKTILQILQAEAKGKHVIEAACGQVCEDLENFKDWTRINDLRERYLYIYVVLCDDPDAEEYTRMINNKYHIEYQKSGPELYGVHYAAKNINCSDLHYLSKNMMLMVSDISYGRMAGVVGAGAGIAAASYNARLMETQLVIYDTPPHSTKLNEAARTVGSDLKSLAHVTQYFITSKGWRRVAVISDIYQISADFLMLIRQSTLIVGARTLEVYNREQMTDVLNKFTEERAKIFLVNTNSEVASAILCTVVELGLGSSDYVWIVREWREPSCDLGSLTYYTISYWWRGGKFPDLPGLQGNATVRRWLDDLWPDRPWPRLAAPLFDSMILLSAATTATIQDDISLRYDLHGDKASKRVTASLNKRTVAGVVQELRTEKGFMLETPLVFIDEWQNATRIPAAVWRINSTNMTIEELKTLKQIRVTENDGRHHCWIYASHEGDFNAECKDWPLILALVVIILILVVIHLARRQRLLHLKARERDIHVKLLARCERTAKVLAGHLVPRSSLTLEDELGKGHFGIVRRGRLRLSNRSVIPVAAKELRNDAVLADEAVFLREGCVMAALEHPNIIKLIAVCAADGPPMLLMEYAFFKDLQKYLRERRLLIDVMSENDLENEAAYVSAPELTRLAREAAAALEYLAQKRYVHRDIRAANCVVTQERTLKLADFGMARSTRGETNEHDPTDEDYRYVCCHKGVFPIMAMAPENINSGVFTTASDVWSLGVLMLEIATLGARPYGDWDGPKIYNHVKEDGHPPFPIDVSYHTRTLLEMCWRSSPDTRPTPEAVKKYLTENPNAIRPALIPALNDTFDHDSDRDSGFRDKDTFNEPQTP